MTAPRHLGSILLALLILSTAKAATAQSDFYAGKTLRVIVGLEAGGTVDTLARAFSIYLRRHIRGNPSIVIQNMPGAGGWGATNYLGERATPDGLTILYGPWDPLAQALGDQGLRARYQDFAYLGGTGDIRVLYARTDLAPGGLKAPPDIVRAGDVILGLLNKSDISGLLPHLALDVLGVKHRMVIGYRGGNDVFLAMQRGEVGFHSTSISTFRSRNSDFIKSGQGIGIAYLVPVERDGSYTKSPYVTEMPAFPDLYREIFGRAPAGALWDALDWLTNEAGEMTYVGFAPHGTPPDAVAVLRKGFKDASEDPDFIRETMGRNGVPFSYVGIAEGEAKFRSLTDVSPDVLRTLRAAIGAGN